MLHRNVAVGVGMGVFCFLTLLPARSVSAGVNAKAQGAEIFATKGCAHCHGAAGVGGTIGPDLQLVRKRMDAKQIALQIHDGGKEMPAYGDELSSAEIDGLVAYLEAKRKLVKVAPVKPAATAPKPDDGPGL